MYSPRLIPGAAETCMSGDVQKTFGYSGDSGLAGRVDVLAWCVETVVQRVVSPLQRVHPRDMQAGIVGHCLWDAMMWGPVKSSLLPFPSIFPSLLMGGSCASYLSL
jgi:hypothetical protein